MITPIQGIVDQIFKGVIINKNWGDKEITSLLKKWGEMIVDEAAGSFECEMEIDPDYVFEGGDKIADIPTVPVLVRSSVLDVKNKIK